MARSRKKKDIIFNDPYRMNLMARGRYLGTPSENYNHNQLLWDRHELSYFCGDCKSRIIVGYYTPSYKSLPSRYAVALAVAKSIHTKSKCQNFQPNIDDYLHRFKKRSR